MPGQDGRADGQVGAAWVAAVCVALAGVLLAAVGVAALRSDTASAETVLARGADAVLVLEDGTTRDAAQGETVPRGATVRAGRTGARLDTRDREVHLGADTAVTVVDGARQVLREGFVMVDASSAPGLELQTRAAVVEASDDSLVRVDGGPLLRVGVLRGEQALVRPAGRRTATELPTYFQVQVPAGGLPGTLAPYVLTPGDAYEMQLAGELVAADADLNALASRLDAAGNAGPAVLAALREQVQPEAAATPAGAPVSERALGYLIATAAQDDQPLPERYTDVRALRTAGGSWGVVAAIVSAPVDRVSAALNALLDPDAVPTVASEPFDMEAALGLGGSGAPAPAGEPAPAPGPAQDDQDGGSAPPSDDRPEPTSSPTSPPPDPQSPEEVVQEVVDTVLDLVSPSPSAPAGVSVPTVSPPPLPGVEAEVAVPSLP